MATIANEQQGALKASLENEYGEGHVFQYASNGLEMYNLCDQLSGIDMKRQRELYEKVIAGSAEAASRFDGANLEPCNDVNRLLDTPAETRALWSNNFFEAVSNGKVALLVLAGGAGTRLGFDGPKGKYSVKSPSNSSLFRFHCDRIRKLERLALQKHGKAVRIQVYVMTSPQNNDETVAFFNDNAYFGLSPEHVRFFAQGTLPCFSNDGGKLMLDRPDHVAVAADGNGGLYPAMYNNGVLDDLAAKGIDYVHTICIDNLLVRALDPEFIGCVITEGADVGSLTVSKRSAQEGLGMLVKLNGKFAIAEYSDVSDDMKNEKDADGRLRFEQGNICIHAFATKFLIEKVVPEYVKKIDPDNYHIARKKIPVWDAATGQTAKPEANNGIKLEMFIFDVFQFAESMAILQVPREEQFSPVKNNELTKKSDSAFSARTMLSDLHKTWLTAAGATVAGDGLVEISPLVSYNGEGLESLNGKTLQTPCYVQPQHKDGPVSYFVDV